MKPTQFLALIVLSACARSAHVGSPTPVAAPEQSASPNTLSSADRAAGWKLLFDGKTTNGWRGYHMQTMPPQWMAMDGTLMKERPTEDIVTTEQFGDFDLVFEWKLGKGGNAGVFYRATEEYPKVYWSATEYQLLDDANAPDGRLTESCKCYMTSSATNYGLYGIPKQYARPFGEWNSSRIIARGNHVEHWLNGQKTVEYDYASPDWAAKVKASKFKDWPNYGLAKRGFIAIQGDHNGPLSIRNIKIRELK